MAEIPKTVLERRRLSVYVNDELLELLRRHVYEPNRKMAPVLLEAMRLYDERKRGEKPNDARSPS